MNDKYYEICKNGILDDIKLFDFDDELEKYLNQYGSSCIDYDTTITVNGIQYYSHYLFFNMVHDTSIYGVLYMNDNNDCIFAIHGNGYDRVNNGIVENFDTMYDMLNDEYFYIDD